VYISVAVCCSRSSLSHNGMTVTDSYPLDLSSLRLGSRVAIMRCSDGSLHYYLDGVDQGEACSNVPSGCLSSM